MSSDPLTSDAIQEQRRQQMRDAILQHALDVMEERGVAGLSLGEVARRLGVKTPSLYEYFPNKKAVYDALFRMGYEQFRLEMRRLQEALPDGSMRARLRSIMAGFFTFALENRALYQLMFERPVPGFVPSEESLAVSFGMLNESYGSFTTAFIENSLQVPEGLSTAQAHDLFIAVEHGITALHLANEPDVPPAESRFGSLLDAAVDLLIRAWTDNPQEDIS
ncbi:MAG: TetR/AcrR family transcriptional regulator [Anaerolineae bacterium]